MIVTSGSMVAATPMTRAAVRVMVAATLASALFLVIRYADLPWLLPVHFKSNGLPNGWQYKTLARVLMPVFVQMALAVTLGTIGMLLLTRPAGGVDPDSPDARAAAVAAEAVTLIGAIWVTFQGYAAFALVNMWTRERAGLGRPYVYFELLGILLTGIVATRAHARLGRPEPKPYFPDHWMLGQLYRNRQDPALFVPTRDGRHWTLNFGRPVAVTLLGLIIAIGVLAPTVIFALALR
jgi:uncharacterized membrane protein